MKILLVNDNAALVGGAEIMAQTLRHGLERRGHDVRLLATADPASAHQPDYPCFAAKPPLQVATQAVNPSARFALRRALREFRPDVVHVRMFLTQLSPLILPPLRDVPSLYHAVMYESICPTGLKLKPDGSSCHDPAGAVCRRDCVSLKAWLPLMLKLHLWRRWRDSFNLVVANSEATRRRLEAEGIAVGAVVPNGVPMVPARSGPTGPPTVVFAGRLAPEKGVDVLLRAFAHLAAEVPDSRLVIAGDGPLRSQLAAEAAAAGLTDRVEFAGHLSRDAVERRFADAWVQAVPSTWDEPFGIVAAEAMMRGTAVVASASGGLAEIVVPGQTGALVRPGDATALAQALIPFLVDRAAADRAGRAGRDRALAHFGEDAFVDRFIAIYQRLMIDRSSHAAIVADRSIPNEPNGKTIR